MGIKITQRETQFDSCFPDDINQYYELANEFANLTTEDYAKAFEISKKGWILADRWSSIASNASKLAALKKTSKTDLYKFCYEKYRQMQYVHEFCRVLWNKGEQASREKRVGA